jgi:ribulose 1,5-bisphosphate synthetase/thiazole synthase
MRNMFWQKSTALVNVMQSMATKGNRSCMDFDDFPVKIGGGGPNGLFVAPALARQGVASRVLERRGTTTDRQKS